MNLYLSNNSALAERIGEKIKELRIEVNMTQHELETAVGVSISTLKQAEKGANISLLKLIQILRALRLLPLLRIPFLRLNLSARLSWQSSRARLKPENVYENDQRSKQQRPRF